MDTTINDPIFGQMQYKHRWYKEEIIRLFNSEWNIRTVAKAYSGKEITDQQRLSYQNFKKCYLKIANTIETSIMKYINDNCNEFSLHWMNAKNITSVDELSTIIKPKTLLVKQDGTTLLLIECPWDEHGLAVQVFPDLQIGPQDAFL